MTIVGTWLPAPPSKGRGGKVRYRLAPRFDEQTQKAWKRRRKALALRAKGWSARRIAAKWGFSESWVNAILRRARDDLRNGWGA